MSGYSQGAASPLLSSGSSGRCQYKLSMPVAVPSTTKAWTTSVSAAGWRWALSLPHGPTEGPWCHPPVLPAVALKELQSLSLQRCPHVDDWCLGRLHQLADSLQELSLAGCPRVSERGLACLHHLQ